MTGSVPQVRIEFYGLARLRAGSAAFMVEASTVGEALAAVDAAFPGLNVVRSGCVSPYYLVALGGREFTADPTRRLAVGDSLVILGADAGG
jgi:hypothetical protein